MSNTVSPIGIFDSGIGGLTVANAIHRSFPEFPIIYFGDTAHLPYGDKSIEHIRMYSHRIVQFLIEKGCKLIVIACNSATSAAIESLQAEYSGTDITIIDVINPLVNEITRSHYQKVGVIATKATVNSQIYQNKIQAQRPDIEVQALATPLLVPMIEEGFFTNSISHLVIDTYLQMPELQHIQALLLACTHYPLIKPEIEHYYQNKVMVYDSIQFVVKEVGSYLEKNKISPRTHTILNHFYVSGYTDSFKSTTKIFFGEQLNLEEVNIW